MGVQKITKIKGDCKTYPKSGQKVTVHYTGYLGSIGGKKFDSSLDRKEPFSFTLNQGEVIAGWDIGIAKMSLGEKAYLICSHDVAYGAGGSPGVIPPYTSLIFEIKLLKIK
ncbi:unnamed protein product [Brachionus calyciflorus]|uniref:peptidylprolyl isomerase n=1 Tax=Brachionus calyciflorus TaxID=104777 RepID=A0A814QE14_9BILA|nr:unnamed protein product [Brachionus calyciflorus]